MITGGFVLTVDLASCATRVWAMGSDGVKRWTDNNELVEPVDKATAVELPRHKCPRTVKKNCPLCGKWDGWIDLLSPGRAPSLAEWTALCKVMQAEHDKTRLREFESLRLMPHDY